MQDMAQNLPSEMYNNQGVLALSDFRIVALGAGSRRFKSSRPDQLNTLFQPLVASSTGGFFIGSKPGSNNEFKDRGSRTRVSSRLAKPSEILKRY